VAMERHPVDIYIDARDSLKSGDKDKAAKLLSESLGSKIVTQPIKNSASKMLVEGNLAHEVALRLLEANVKETNK